MAQQINTAQSDSETFIKRCEVKIEPYNSEYENYCYQISDDDLEDCDDLGEDSLLEEADCPSAGGGASGRGPYERAWTTDATRALIHIRGPMEGRFTEGRQKRTALWLQCTRQLQKLGYRYSAAKVQKKWHNILITYNKNLGKKYQAGHVHWEFFEEMFKYLQGKKANCEAGSVGSQYQQQQQQQRQQQDQHQQQTQQQQQQHLQQQQQQQQLQQQKPPQPQQRRQTQQQQQQPYYSAEEHLPEQSHQQHYHDSYFPPSKSPVETTASFQPLLHIELKKPKLEYNDVLPLEISHANGNDEHELAQTGKSAIHSNDIRNDYNGINQELKPDDSSLWWQNYFERKLQVDREKIQLQKDMHREQMQFQKMSLNQQEKIERIKIDAINNLTTALQKLVETKSRRVQ